MSHTKMAVVLSAEQILELRMILADRDGEEALRFLKEIIWAQVEAARRKGLQSHLEKGQP